MAGTSKRFGELFPSQPGEGGSSSWLTCRRAAAVAAVEARRMFQRFCLSQSSSNSLSEELSSRKPGGQAGEGGVEGCPGSPVTGEKAGDSWRPLISTASQSESGESALLWGG